MDATIKDFYETIFNINEPNALNKLVQNSRVVNVNKKTHLFRIGDLVDEAYFLNKGFAYGYIDKSKNRKIIEGLIYWRGGLAKVGTKLEAEIIMHNVFCPADSQFIVIPFDKLQEVINESPEAKKTYIRVLNETVLYHQKIHHIRILPFSERVTFFFENFSECIEYMSNTEIAAFLNISRTEFTKAFKSAIIHKGEQ